MDGQDVVLIVYRGLNIGFYVMCPAIGFTIAEARYHHKRVKTKRLVRELLAGYYLKGVEKI